MWETEWEKNNHDKMKEQKMDQVPERKLQKRATIKIVQKALAAMDNFSNGESDDKRENKDLSLMAMDDSNSYDKNILALMANSDSEVEKE